MSKDKGTRVEEQKQLYTSGTLVPVQDDQGHFCPCYLLIIKVGIITLSPVYSTPDWNQSYFESCGQRSSRPIASPLCANSSRSISVPDCSHLSSQRFGCNLQMLASQLKAKYL